MLKPTYSGLVLAASLVVTACSDGAGTLPAPAERIGGDAPAEAFRKSCLTTAIGYMWEPTGGSVDHFTSAMKLADTAVIAWERAGDDRQILRITSTDPLTRANEEIGMEFVAGADGETTDACGPGRVVLRRIVMNGAEIPEHRMPDLLTQFVDHNDLRPQPVAGISASETSTSSGSAQALGPIAAAPEAAVESASDDYVWGQCRVEYQGRTVIDGDCNGTATDYSAFITAAEGGCTVELVWASQGTVGNGKLFGYRNACWIDEQAGRQVEQDVSLGEFTKVDGCWVGANAKLCLYAGD